MARLDGSNYSDRKSYQSDYRNIVRQRKAAMMYLDMLSNDHDLCHEYGRLTINSNDLDYTPGQYAPVEIWDAVYCLLENYRNIRKRGVTNTQSRYRAKVHWYDKLSGEGMVRLSEGPFANQSVYVHGTAFGGDVFGQNTNFEVYNGQDVIAEIMYDVNWAQVSRLTLPQEG